MLKGKHVEYVWIWLLTGEYWIAVSTGISSIETPFFLFNLPTLLYTLWIVSYILFMKCDAKT